jgi:hypothetical protein
MPITINKMAMNIKEIFEPDRQALFIRFVFPVTTREGSLGTFWHQRNKQDSNRGY